MSIFAPLALALGLAAGQPQTPPPPPQTAAPGRAGDTTVLDEIVVEGRRLDEFVRDFVNEIAAPARQRGLARWYGPVCVGVVNLEPQAAQFIADRVSAVALEVGLTPREPGCKPNIVIVASTDGASLATELVRDQPGDFDLGTSKTDMGDRALRAFQTDDRAVRWWATSMPVDSETGRRAIRLPGDTNPSGGQPSAPTINVFAASRINSQIRDDMTRTVVIVDVDQIGQTSLPQLADYLAMVSLAQIDPQADVTSYPSILNLFKDAETPSGITDWDMTYLKGLYATHPSRLNPGSQVTAITNIVTDARRDAAIQEDETPSD